MQVTRTPPAPSSLGDYERLAGIDDRARFWLPFTPLDRISTQLYIDSGIEALDRLIQARVRRGELTLLCSERAMQAAREARNGRLRAHRKSGAAA